MLAWSTFLLLLSLLAAQIKAAPLFSSLPSSFRTRADPLCNGYAALCGRNYSDITFVGTHDSPFVGPLPSQNQEKSVNDQLNGGMRFLQSQTHNFAGLLMMCHTNCVLEDGGTVEDYLNTVKMWLDQNPRDVVTLLLTNPEHLPVSKFDAVFKSVGLNKYAFVPATSPAPLSMTAWPTLGDMITADQRLVVFMDYGANEKSVPYILDEFNYFFETPYDTTDKNFAECKIDRQNKVNNDGSSSMYIVNHFLDVDIFSILVPDKNDVGRTNAITGAGSIGAQSALCNGIYKRNPNAVLIDYFGRGDAIGAQKELNGL